MISPPGRCPGTHSVRSAAGPASATGRPAGPAEPGVPTETLEVPSIRRGPRELG